MTGKNHGSRRVGGAKAQPTFLTIAAHALLCVTVVCLCLAPSGLWAQRARLAVDRGPYYVGQPIRLQLSVSGFEDDAQPEVQLPSDLPEDLQLRLVGVSPQTSSSTVIINGRMTSSRSVTYSFTYDLTASEAGSYKVGPFKVTLGDQEATSGSGTLDFEEIPTDSNMTIEFDLPDRPFYAGERIPATIRWSYTGDLQRLGNPVVRAPILDRFDAEAVTTADQQSTLTLQTSTGEVRVPASVTSSGRSGNETIRVEAPLELRANEVGEFEFEPPSATIQVVTEWARDPFGDLFGGMGRMGTRRAAAARVVRSEGNPLSIKIKPLPTEGRPASFAGAVGPQYGIETEVNRTVVRVDDPIRLTVTLMGDSFLKTAQLPNLSADSDMSPEHFLLPEEPPSGTYQDGRRQFEVTVRVLDESVSEIPALAYSWFNPITEQYETARSNPIAMRVLPAQVVSSDNVVSARPSTTESASSKSNASESPRTNRPSSPLLGLDLSIEEDAGQLVRGSGGSVPWLPAVPYAVGTSAVIWAFVDRRRTTQAARGGKLRRELEQQLQRIQAAASKPQRQAAEDVATSLRALLPHASEADRAAADSLIAQCEALLFAPNGNSATLDPQLISQAAQAAEAILDTPNKAHAHK